MSTTRYHWLYRTPEPGANVPWQYGGVVEANDSTSAARKAAEGGPATTSPSGSADRFADGHVEIVAVSDRHWNPILLEVETAPRAKVLDYGTLAT